MYPFSVKIKRSDGQPDFEVSISSAGDCVNDLKCRIYDKFSIEGHAEINPNTKSLRLIHAGKLLQPDTALLTTFAVAADGFVHLLVSDASSARRRPPPSNNNSGLARLAGLFSLIGGGGQSVSQSSSGNETEMSNITAPGTGTAAAARAASASRSSGATAGGFDILADTHGLEASEISALRAIFSDDIENFERTVYDGSPLGASVAQERDRGGGEEFERAHRLRIETAWILRQGAGSEFLTNLPRRQRDGSIPGRRGPGNSAHVRAQRQFRLGPNAGPGLIEGERGRDRDRDRDTEELDEMVDGVSGRGQAQPTGIGGLISALFSRRGGNYARVPGDTAAEDDIEGGNSGYSGFSHTNRPAPPREPMDEPDLNPYAEPPTGIDQLGTTRDFLWGLIMGFVFGPIVLMCICERSMNYRCRLGIIAGVITQLILTLQTGAAIANQNEESQKAAAAAATAAA